jgi:peptidoglycan/LPS O-acetylase OafA/YrhL
MQVEPHPLATGATPATATARLDGVDGLRVLAAVAVLVFHVAGVVGLQYGTGPMAWILARGESRVAVFFAVSGLLLYRPWVRSLLLDDRPPSTRVYAVRRVLRIFPLYWVVAVTSLLVFNLDRLHTFGDWAEVLLLAHVFDPDPWWPAAQLGPIGLQQMWTLSVDVSFYLVLPLLAAALGGLARMRGAGTDARAVRVLAALAVLSLASFGYLYLIRFPVYTMRMEWWLPRFFPWFAAGMAVCVLTVWARAGTPAAERVRAWCESVARSPGTCLTLAAVAFGATATPLGGPKTALTLVPELGHDAFRLAAYTVMGFLLVAPVAMQPRERTWVNVALGNAAMRWLANLSYGLFAWQILVIWGYYHLTGRPRLDMGFLPVFSAVLAVTLVLAWVSYQLVERPARALGKRLEARRRAGDH